MIGFFYRRAYMLLRIYWFLFRPSTYGVKAIVIHDGRALLVRHSYGAANWAFPGGGIKRGEKPHEAARRELKEEVGIVPLGLAEIGQFISEREYKRDHVTVFLARSSDDSVRIDHKEIREAAWKIPSAVQTLTPINETAWDIYKKHVQSQA